jgi:uncharacterized protein (TIGR03437 family)
MSLVAKLPDQDNPTMKRQVLLCSFIVASHIPSLPGGPLHPQNLLGIGTEPGQQISNLQVDGQGNVIVATLSGLVQKIDSQGTGTSFTRSLPGTPTALAVDQNGDIYVGGSANAFFPFTSLLYTGSSASGPGGGFVAKLNGGDGTLAYAAEVAAAPTSLLVDASGQALFTMNSLSGVTVPLTPGAYSSAGGGFLTSLMYLERISSGGDRILLTALYSGSSPVCITPTQCQEINGGTDGSQVMTDAQGNIWVVGVTNTTDLRVTPNALKSKCGCSEYAGDGFVAEFSNDGSKLLYATYFGTTPSDALSSNGQDSIISAAIDTGGHLWIVGSTNGSDLPVTSNAVQQKLSGGTDGFIAEYDPATNTLLYVSYFGGTGADSITNVEIAPDGTVIFTGHSNSPALPIAASGFTRGLDFLATLDPATYDVTFLTTFASGSVGTGLASAANGSEVISGASNLATFLAAGAPTTNLYSVTNAANFLATGQVAAGELITLFGANIGPSTPATADLTSGTAPTQLGGVRVLAGNTPIPLLYAQQDQINAIVPFDSTGQPLTVSNGPATSNQAAIELTNADPQPFSQGASFAAAINQDGTVNSQSEPAAAGSIVSVFGQLVAPPITDGTVINTPKDQALLVQVTDYGPPPVQYPASGLPLQATLGSGQPLQVIYAGQAPTLIGGVSQVNFVLPTPGPMGSSNLVLQFNVGGELSLPFLLWVSTGHN